MDNIKEVKIELTSKCQRNCLHCSSEATICDFMMLDKETVKKVIDMAKEAGTTSIVFTGGEPMLYPYLKDVVAYAKSKDLNIKLYTMCDPDDISINKLTELNSLGLNEIIYSLAYQLTTDNKINLSKVKEFIDKLIKESNLKIGFHYVITNKTIDDTNKIVAFVNSFNSPQITNLSFLRYVAHGRGDSSLLPSKEQMNRFKRYIEDIYNKKEINIKLGSPFNVLNITHHDCTAASETVIVGVNGHVYPCDNMKYFDYLGTGGNIYHNTLEQIMNSDYFNKIKSFRCHVSSECLECKNYTLCQGGCLGQKMIYHFNGEKVLTAEDYEVNTLRTMNKYKNQEIQYHNWRTGIFGESGELFECIKKLYDHDLNDRKKEKIRKIMKREIGDIIWYIAAPMANFFNFSFNDVVAKIIGYNSEKMKKIDRDVIKNAAEEKDPICPYKKVTSLPISLIEEHIDTNNYYGLKEDILYLSKMTETILCQNREKIITLAAELILLLGRIAKCELGITIEEALQENIEKLRKMYPNGFDSNKAGKKIGSLLMHKMKDIFR